MHDAAASTVASGECIFSRRCEGCFDAVRNVLIDLTSTLTQRGYSPEETGSVELVLAEAMNNVVEHAYTGEKGGDITVDVSDSARGLLFSVVDSGVEMPEGKLPFGMAADPTAEIADLPEGGFGWFLIREIARDLEYSRTDGTNKVTFRIAVGEVADAV